MRKIVFFFFVVSLPTLAVVAPIKLLFDSNEGWESRIKLIRNAKKSINIQTFLLSNDEYGSQLIKELINKSKAGVEVKLIFDNLLSNNFVSKISRKETLDEPLEKLVAAGGKVKITNKEWRFNNLFVSNHKKMMVIDEEYIIVGGRNIDKIQFDNDNPNKFEDLDLLIQSKGLAKEMLDDFNFTFDNTKFQFTCSSNQVLITKPLPLIYEDFDFNLESDAYYLFKHSKFNKNTGSLNPKIREMIYSTENNLIISTLYLDEELYELLLTLKNKNIQVEILTNSGYNSRYPPYKFKYPRVCKKIKNNLSFVKIFNPKNSKTNHAKFIVKDNYVALVGSHNLDHNSFHRDNENAVLLFGVDFITSFKEEIKKYKNSLFVESTCN